MHIYTLLMMMMMRTRMSSCLFLRCKLQGSRVKWPIPSSAGTTHNEWIISSKSPKTWGERPEMGSGIATAHTRSECLSECRRGDLQCHNQYLGRFVSSFFEPSKTGKVGHFWLVYHQSTAMVMVIVMTIWFGCLSIIMIIFMIEQCSNSATAIHIIH